MFTLTSNISKTIQDFAIYTEFDFYDFAHNPDFGKKIHFLKLFLCFAYFCTV